MYLVIGVLQQQYLLLPGCVMYTRVVAGTVLLCCRVSLLPHLQQAEPRAGRVCTVAEA